MGDKLMKVWPDFGQRIDVPRSTAYDIVKAGHVDVVNIGSKRRPRLRISEAAYQRYIRSREHKGRRAA
jgi:hypothetical protein